MKTKKILAVILSAMLLLGMMSSTAVAHAAYIDDEAADHGHIVSTGAYTAPVGVTMKPLGDHYVTEPENYGDDFLFVIKEGGRYYAMKDVPAREKGYSSIPAIDVTDWINPDGTLTVPADTLGVAFWRYEDYGFLINGRNDQLAYTYDYESTDGDDDYSNDAERTYSGEFMILTREDDQRYSTPYFQSEDKVIGTLLFGGSWSEWINKYNYVTHTYEMYVDVVSNEFGEHYFKFCYAGTDVDYEGDEVEGYLYYGECRHQYTVRHAEYDAPTCMDKGCEAYWYCEGCMRYAKDADFTELLRYKPVLPALGHDYGDTACENCQRPVPVYTKITSYEQFRTVKPGASFIMVAEIDDGNGGKEYYVLKEPLNIVNADADEDGVADILLTDENANGTPDVLEADEDGDGVADAMMYDGIFGDDYLDGVLDEEEIDYYLFELENQYTNGYMVDMRMLDAIRVLPENGAISVKGLGALEIYMERLIPDSKLEEQYYGDGATVKDYENDFIFRIPNYWIRPMVTVDNNYYDGRYEQGDSKWWGVLFGRDVKEIASERFDEAFPDDAVVLFTERFYSLNRDGELEHALRFLVNGENKNFVITSEYYWEEMTGTQIPIYLYSSDAGETGHEHLWGTWSAFGEDVHKRVCTVEGCTAFDLASHVYGEECTPDTENYELGHWVTCTDCGAAIHEPHTRESAGTYYPNNWIDTEDGVHHVVYCSKCHGPVEYAEHRWYDWYAGAKEIDGEWVMGHYTRCKDYPCQAEMWQAECIYDEGTVTKEPTCTEPGIRTYVCTGESCSLDTKTHTEEIPALGHEWSEWQGTGDPTKEERFCHRDPTHREERTVVLHEHVWGPWEADENGDSHSRRCTDEECNEIQTEKHGWDNGTETESPSCTEPGTTLYTCSTCQETKTEEIPPLDHDWGEWQYNGTDLHFRECRRACGVVREEMPHAWTPWKPIDDISHERSCPICQGHNKEEHLWDEGVITLEPTCTEEGMKTYTCLSCLHTKEEKLPVLSHAFGDWKPVDGKTHSRHCSCGESETADHQYDDGVITDPPTHTAKGVVLYTCTDCGHSYTEDVPMLTDHKWSDWVVNKTDEANTHIRFCICNESEIAPHVFDDGQITVQPTHTSTGKAVYTCTDCGYSYEGELPALTAHEWSNWVVSDTDEAYSHIRFCRCGEIEIDYHFFDYGTVTEETTHTSTGIMTYTCIFCGYSYEEEIPETAEHEWTSWSPNGDGTHTRSCRCNATETLSCEWDEGVVTEEPTHLEAGVKCYTCGVCGDTKAEEVPKLTDHEWGEWIVNKTDEANTHIRFCICNESETAPHAFDEGKVTAEATHTATGVKTYTCADCGYTYTEEIPTTPDHEWTPWSPDGDGTHARSCRCNAIEREDCLWNGGEVTEKATHYEEGTRTYTCTVCGNTKTESIEKTAAHEWGEWAKLDDTAHVRECKCGETEKADHTFGEGTVTKEPTHLDTGIRTYTCADCGYVREEILEKTSAHTFGEWQCDATVVGKHSRACACGETETADCQWNAGTVTEEPTYESAGTMTYTCTVCGGEKREAIPQLVKVEELVSPDNSEIKIQTPEGSTATLDENTVLKVEEIKEEASEDVKANVEIVVGDANAEVLASYDVSLILDGAAVQPGGQVEVTLPAPENAEEYESLQVVYVDDEGKVTPCETRVNEDGTVTFVTDHFSHYAIVGIPGTSPLVWILISSISVVLLAAAVVALIIIKKRKGIA